MPTMSTLTPTTDLELQFHFIALFHAATPIRHTHPSNSSGELKLQCSTCTPIGALRYHGWGLSRVIRETANRLYQFLYSNQLDIVLSTSLICLFA